MGSLTTTNRFVMAILMVSVFGWSGGQMAAQSEEAMPDYCINTFEAFAHEGPRPGGHETYSSPQPPWEVDETISADREEKEYQVWELALILEWENGRELWLRTAQGDGFDWVVYSPETGVFKYYPGEIQVDGRTLHVFDLFGDDNGRVWGRLYPPYSPPGSEDESATRPILGEFNRNTEQFEPAEGISELPDTWRVLTLFDGDHTFWFIVESDGGYVYDSIYRYFPDQGITEKVFALPDVRIYYDYATLAPDGSIYFEDLGGVYDLDGGIVYQFIPETGDLRLWEIPQENWPFNQGILVDQSNRLWLGAVGYLTPEGTWQLIHTDVEGYHEFPIQASWAAPKPVLVSSDGRLWYSQWADSSLNYQGAGWYHPDTGEGCMFTNAPASILEDSEGRIWMVVKGELYSAHLDDL